MQIQTILLLVGYLSLIVYSLRQFRRIRQIENVNSVSLPESHIPAVAFGTALFGTCFLVYHMLSDKEPIHILIVGVMWTSIINGFVSCTLMRLGYTGAGGSK